MGRVGKDQWNVRMQKLAVRLPIVSGQASDLIDLMWLLRSLIGQSPFASFGFRSTSCL